MFLARNNTRFYKICQGERKKILFTTIVGGRAVAGLSGILKLPPKIKNPG